MCVCVQSQPKTFFQFSRLKVARQSAPQTIRMLGQGATNRLALVLTPLSDDHSRVEPPLPIPNRTVKRSRANDSRHLACESRSSSDSLSVPRSTLKPPPNKRGFFISLFYIGKPCGSTGWRLGCSKFVGLFVQINQCDELPLQLKLYRSVLWLKVSCCVGDCPQPMIYIRRQYE